MLEIIGLSHTYRNGNIGISDISFSLASGKILAVAGNNGSGKTTLLNCLYEKLGDRSAFVPQFFNISSISVRDFVGLGMVRNLKPFQLTYSSTQKSRINEILDITGLLNICEKPMTEISGGERQTAKIAQSLVVNPEILLLDEPTSHLDLANTSKVMSIIREICIKENACAVVILHDIYSIRKYCDYVLMLKCGKQFGFCDVNEFSDGNISELFSVNYKI